MRTEGCAMGAETSAIRKLVCDMLKLKRAMDKLSCAMPTEERAMEKLAGAMGEEVGFVRVWRIGMPRAMPPVGVCCPDGSFAMMLIGKLAVIS